MSKEAHMILGESIFFEKEKKYPYSCMASSDDVIILKASLSDVTKYRISYIIIKLLILY